MSYRSWVLAWWTRMPRDYANEPSQGHAVLGHWCCAQWVADECHEEHRLQRVTRVSVREVMGSH